jgi:hypothetical protein
LAAAERAPSPFPGMEGAMDWMQILLVIMLLGICIELAYVVKAIGSTNRLLGSLLKHIKP